MKYMITEINATNAPVQIHDSILEGEVHAHEVLDEMKDILRQCIGNVCIATEDGTLKVCNKQ